MREYITLFLGFIAVIIFVIALISGFLMETDSDEGSIVGEQEIKDNSVTSAKIADNSITDNDISSLGISKISDNSIKGDHIVKNTISLEHLSDSILDALKEISNLTVVDFNETEVDSIDGSYITDETITNAKINPEGISKIADNAIKSDHILDNSINLEDLSKSLQDVLSSIEDTKEFAGEVIVGSISYKNPREHYYSVGGEHFQPTSNIDFASGGGCGGAYLFSGSGSLVAAVNLPDNAVITSFKVFFYDVTNNDMTVYLYAQNLNTCNYNELANIQSDQNNGYYSKNTDDINQATNVIDNQNYAYHVKASSENWSSSLKIKGAVIGYSISEVE